MKRILAVFLVVIMFFSVIPVTARAAESVTLTIKSNKGAFAPGEVATFTVTLGEVDDLGGLEFNLVIPEGLTIDMNSISVPEGLEDTLDSVMNIIKPSSENQYKWGFFAGRTGYAGNSDLLLLTFSCVVDADADIGSKTVTVDVKTCFDNSASLINAVTVPANITISTGNTDTENPGTGNPGTGNPGTGNPGTETPGTGNPGTENPGTGNPGTGNPGTGNPGTENPGTENTQQPDTGAMGGSNTNDGSNDSGNSSSHVKDDTPKTADDKIDAKYFFFAGVLLLGIYLVISGCNVKKKNSRNK